MEQNVNEKKNNIILIGMPGVGKSSAGIVLAKKLGYSFIDSDLLIQEQEGMLLHEIIEQKGLGVFNDIENQVNAAIEAERSVIATGGSVVYGEEAMQHLKLIGRVVYLYLPYHKLEERLGDLNERGVSMQPEQTLKSLYKERAPLYEAYADLTINCDNLPIRLVVKRIAELINF